jgi:hypothetical protein
VHGVDADPQVLLSPQLVSGRAAAHTFLRLSRDFS